MDVISLGKASQALNKVKDLNDNVVAPLAESRFPTVDARLDWLEGQAGKIKAANSKQQDLSKGTFTNTEVSGGKIQLKSMAVDPKYVYEQYNVSYTWSAEVTTNDGFQNGAYPNGYPSHAYDDIIGYSVSGTQVTGMTTSGTRWFSINNGTDVRSIRHASVTPGSGSTYYTSTRTKITNQGSLVGIVNAPDGTYPDNGIASDGFWYVKQGIAGAYATQGTWESPIIDCGDGWLDTTAVDIIKNTIATGTICTLEISSSADGITFTPYATFDPAHVPQVRYVKIRATLSATAGATTPVALDFNQGDAQNTFTLDSQVVADGKLALKTSYSIPAVDSGVAGSGEVYSFTIDRNSYKSIEKVSVT
jgi:hypothetical protein